MTKPDSPIAGIIIIGLMLMIYFIPAIVAQMRRHRNKDPIIIINLFLGWTFLGWVIALAWAYTDYVHPKPGRRDEAMLRNEMSRREPRL